MRKITFKLLGMLMFWALLAGCGQGKMLKNESTSIEKVEKEASTTDNQLSEIEEVNYDTIEFRFLPKEEQYKRAEPFHVYGDLRLKMGDPLGYYYKDEKKGFEVREGFPGVLNYFHRGEKPYSGFKLEFYNKEKELVKTIDLEKKTPYNEQNYPGLGHGYLNGEYYEIADHFDPNYRNLLVKKFFNLL